MRPPVWESSSRPQVAAEGLLEIRKEAFLFEKAGHCKKVYRLFKIHGNAVAKTVPAHRQVRLSLKREVL
jgi:hypothetical protein